jgi:hypothetical protein
MRPADTTLSMPRELKSKSSNKGRVGVVISPNVMFKRNKREAKCF